MLLFGDSGKNEQITRNTIENKINLAKRYTSDYKDKILLIWHQKPNEKTRILLPENYSLE